MSAPSKLSKIEILKENSRQLRGTLAEELAPSVAAFNDDNANLLKLHGMYQQDDRDTRGGKGEDGKTKTIIMIRTRIPGGKMTADGLLAELDLCDEFGNGTLRITSRQGLQLHGVPKDSIKNVIRGITERVKLTTWGACGDVNRNVMCCPAPHRNNKVHDEMQALAFTLAEHFKSRSTAYREIWLSDEGEETKVAEFKPVEEPIYGERYLPRKFKMGIALPEDNCVDILTYDLGLLAIVQGGVIQGYNIYVGGGQGVTPANKKTFPAVGQKLGFVFPEDVLATCEAIVKVWRDYGNREDRKQARIKYLLRDWGIEKFKAYVEEYLGNSLGVAHPIEPYGVDDHLGWREQGDGKWYLGINVENGRIKDDGDVRMKSAIRALLGKFPREVRLTALQSVIICDIDDSERAEIDSILKAHGVQSAEEQTPLRRLAIACPALPTCGLSVTDSERVMPQAVAQIQSELDKLGMPNEPIAVHMTGCPNGCARPYSPDIGLVGKARGKYTMYVGGNVVGSRIGFIFKDLVPLEEIGQTVAPLLKHFQSTRIPGETFGDFCYRVGLDELTAAASA